jgi:hypothetical protein
MATLYGYSVPGAVNPHVAAATDGDGKEHMLLESENVDDVITLLEKLGQLLDLTPSILPSLDTQRGRTWTISS